MPCALLSSSPRAVASTIAFAPINIHGIPSNYNFTNVPFDSLTAYFFFDYIEGAINAILDGTNKASFLKASSTLLSAVRKLHAITLWQCDAAKWQDSIDRKDGHKACQQ
jgi:hypothetical protein